VKKAVEHDRTGRGGGDFEKISPGDIPHLGIITRFWRPIFPISAAGSKCYSIGGFTGDFCGVWLWEKCDQEATPAEKFFSG
jgi:hypothetical protein